MAASGRDEPATERSPAEVVVVARGALGETLGKRLGAAAGGCRRLQPTPGDLASLADGGVATLVYVAGAGEAAVPDLEAAGRVLEGARRAGVGHLVLVASAAVHQPSAHHAGHVGEDRLARQRLGNAVARSWLELEELAATALAGSGVALTVLRPSAVPTPGGRDPVSRLFAGRWALVPAGFDPSLQLLAPEDLGDAVARVVEKGASAAGVYHVAPAAVMPLKKALRAAGRLRLPLPTFLLRLGRSAGELDYLRYPWTVSVEKIRRELGFEPRRSSADAVAELTGRTPVAEEFDKFGMDPGYVARLGRTLFRFLHDVWWRVEWQGLEHVPRDGRAVLAGVHRGHQPWDAVMTFHLLVRELGRYPRYLIHPTLVKFPFLAPYMIKCGGIHACQENADWVLERDGLLAIFPEGIRGAFTMYRDAYKLGKFGRDEYVKIALRHRAPIIPYVTVGSAEIFPILARVDWKWWKRHSEWPFFPITPTMGSVPLPSKWHTWFLEPIWVDEYPPEAAADRATVRAISQQVRQRMEEAFAVMLERRKSIWWGSVFADEAGTPAGGDRQKTEPAA